VTRAFLGLGSNVGERLDNLRQAVRLLRAHGIEVRRSSRIYETAPVGGPEGQDDYLNAVIEVLAEDDAHALLGDCLAVEEEMGRVRSERWGPRVIDVDVLVFGTETIDEPDLVIPHPRMHERMFVLAPLLELDADPMLPGGRQVATMRLGAATISEVRPYAPPLV
jgi:2-amino-4-hydroxy-6-hydroxymethyldihydropteridine diphosphokinase